MTVQDSGSQPTDKPRREPELGRFDELQFRQPASERSRSREWPAHGFVQRIRSWDWRWIAAVALFAAALLMVLRQPLADWLWPQTRAERLRAQAARALAEGRLTAPDGSGARELYSAALALDPDRSDARAGLDRVGQAALAQARAAMSRRQFTRAREALELAGDLSVPRAQTEALRE